MKRKGHLYEATYDFNNIVDAYNEVCRNTKNKRNKQKTASEIFVISLAAFRYMWKK